MFQWDDEKKRRWGIPLIVNTMLLMVLMICLNGCGREMEETDSELEGSYVISDTLDVPSSTVEDTEEESTSDAAQELTGVQGTEQINELKPFSDLAEYKDVIYQNVQLGDYTQADWEKLPVDSNFFTVANDTIYYMPGIDWNMYFGDPITYSIYRCNLDGSQQECMFSVDNCQMGTAGICGNYLYGEYYENDEVKNIIIDIRSGEVQEIHMACDEGEYGRLLGMSDSYLYYDCGSQIYRSDYESRRAESICAYESDLYMLNNLTDIKMYKDAVYAMKLVDNSGEPDSYVYEVVKIALQPSTKPESLPLKVTGINNAQFQIMKDKIYTCDNNHFNSFELQNNLSKQVTEFEQPVYNVNLKCEDEKGIYAIISTDLDEKTQIDQYAVLIKEDGSCETLAGWYVP